MKKDIILSGVGGQGILTLAYVLDNSANDLGYCFKQSEVHGMSQRGGQVVSHLRISSKEIFSDLIPTGECDLIISVEPLEALRYVSFLSKNGVIVTNTAPFKNISNYPDEEKIKSFYSSLPKDIKVIFINADELAKKAGSVNAQNTVMIGASSGFLDISESELKKHITNLFSAKGQNVVDINMRAFDLGKEAGSSLNGGSK